MTQERACHLRLPLMVEENQDAKDPFTVSADVGPTYDRCRLTRQYGSRSCRFTFTLR